MGIVLDTFVTVPGTGHRRSDMPISREFTFLSHFCALHVTVPGTRRGWRNHGES